MSAVTIFTTTGRALLAAAVANGQALASAKIAVGDGNGQVYVPNESQTTLVHEVWRGLASVARTDDLVVFRATIPANVGDFIVHELGLYLGPVGAEQLFIISQSPSREKIATPANGGGPMEVSVHFSANAAQVAVLPAGSSGTAVLQLQNAPHITVDGIITAPPGNPADGMLYAIDTGASGTFTGQAGNLVERVAGAWVFRPMRNYSIIRDASNGTWFERSGADWVTFSFNDTSVAWTEVTGKPGEFPPAVHNHDDRYFTEAEADGRFVRLNPAGGASQTVGGPLVTGALSAPSATLSGALDAVSAIVRGVATISPTSGGANLILDSLASGGERPAIMLRKQGSARGTISAEGSGSGAVFHEAFGSSPCHQFFTNTGGAGSVQRVSINADGSLSVNGSTGTSQKVLAGGVAAWANVIDLLPFKEEHVVGVVTNDGTFVFPNSVDGDLFDVMWVGDSFSEAASQYLYLDYSINNGTSWVQLGLLGVHAGAGGSTHPMGKFNCANVHSSVGGTLYAYPTCTFTFTSTGAIPNGYTLAAGAVSIGSGLSMKWRVRGVRTDNTKNATARVYVRRIYK